MIDPRTEGARLTSDRMKRQLLLLKRKQETVMNESRPPLLPLRTQAAIQQVRLGEYLRGARAPRRVVEDTAQMLGSRSCITAHQSLVMGSHAEWSDFNPTRLSDDAVATDLMQSRVDVSPPEIVRRRTVTGHGTVAESVQATSRTKLQYRFRAPMHLLVIHEKGERRDGETFVDGRLWQFERVRYRVPQGNRVYP